MLWGKEKYKELKGVKIFDIYHIIAKYKKQILDE